MSKTASQDRVAESSRKLQQKRRDSASSGTSSTILSDFSSSLSGKNEEEVGQLIEMITRSVLHKQIMESGDETNSSLDESNHSNESSVDTEALAQLIFDSVRKAAIGVHPYELARIGALVELRIIVGIVESQIVSGIQPRLNQLLPLQAQQQAGMR